MAPSAQSGALLGSKRSSGRSAGSVGSGGSLAQLLGLGGPRRTSSSPDKTAEAAMLAAAVAFVVSLILLCHFIVAAGSSEYHQLMRMVDVDTGRNSTTHCTNALLSTCAGSMLTSVIGCAAVQFESRGALSAWFLLSLVSAVLFLWFAAWGWMLGAALAPRLAIQEQEFCNASTHSIFYNELSCSYSHIPPKEMPCGIECRAQVDSLREMGGCRFLRDLCHHQYYADLGRGKCQVEGDDGPGSLGRAPHVVGYKTPVLLNGSAEADLSIYGSDWSVYGTCCEAFCGIAEGCTGFELYAPAKEPDATPRCHLVSRNLPPSDYGSDSGDFGGDEDRRRLCANYTWTVPASQVVPTTLAPALAAPVLAAPVLGTPGAVLPGAPSLPSSSSSTPAPEAFAGMAVMRGDGREDWRCFRKEGILYFFESFADTWNWLTIGCGLATGPLLAAALCACLLQYSLTTRRRGRKGAAALIAKMFCPCSESTHRVNRVNGVQLQSAQSKRDEDNDEASDAGSSDSDSGSDSDGELDSQGKRVYVE